MKTKLKYNNFRKKQKSSIKNEATLSLKTIAAVIFVFVSAVALIYLILKNDVTTKKSESSQAKEKYIPRGMVGGMKVKQPAMISLDKLKRCPKTRPNVAHKKNIKTQYNDPTMGGELPDVKFHLNNDEINIIATGKNLESENQVEIFDAIKEITKGDGDLRKIKVNGKKVPRQIVGDAMFENQDFMEVIDQFPLKKKPFYFDGTHKEQKSQFGPMYFPDRLGLGMDVIRRGSNNDKITISNTGRFKN